MTECPDCKIAAAEADWPGYTSWCSDCFARIFPSSEEDEKHDAAYMALWNQINSPPTLLERIKAWKGWKANQTPRDS